jgi:hypothetical protein
MKKFRNELKIYEQKQKKQFRRQEKKLNDFFLDYGTTLNLDSLAMMQKK